MIFQVSVVKGLAASADVNTLFKIKKMCVQKLHQVYTIFPVLLLYYSILLFHIIIFMSCFLKIISFEEFAASAMSTSYNSLLIYNTYYV